MTRILIIESIWQRLLSSEKSYVIYGLDGLKVHSKLCQITRRCNGKITYITQIGTGNYNETTSRIYTDLSLVTTNEDIARDAANVFQALALGDTVDETSVLMVAPNCLQNKVIALIDRDSRIYIFGEGEREQIYIASADFMTRNTVRRVEVAVPIIDDIM